MPKVAAAIFTHFVPELPELRSGMVTDSVFSGTNASDPFGAAGASPCLNPAFRHWPSAVESLGESRRVV